MGVPAPHFLLFSESRNDRTRGDWKFVLRATDGSQTIEVEDKELSLHNDRLELIAVVRGLEALEQPSHVTLVTTSKYVARGIREGLNEWREHEYSWERHGEMVPIKNQDLWIRIDRALMIHNVDCKVWRYDQAHGSTSAQLLVHEELDHTAESDQPSSEAVRVFAQPFNMFEPRWPTRRPPKSLRHRLRRMRHAVLRWRVETFASWRLRLAQCGTGLLPLPWIE